MAWDVHVVASRWYDGGCAGQNALALCGATLVGPAYELANDLVMCTDCAGVLRA